MANALSDRGFEPTLHACFSDADTAPCPVIDYHKDKRIYYRRDLRHLSGLSNDFDSVWVFDHSPAANFAAMGAFPEAPHVIRIFASPCQSWSELLRPPFSLQYTMHCAVKNALLARAALLPLEMCVLARGGEMTVWGLGYTRPYPTIGPGRVLEDKARFLGLG